MITFSVFLKSTYMQTGAGKGTTKNDSLAGGGSWGDSLDVR